LILNGTNNNIRSTLKSGDIQRIELIKKNTWGAVLFLANNYTGANFKKDKLTKRLDKDDIELIDACQGLILNQFPMLSLEELKLSFEMASAGKFESLNMETYYGKFSVQFLGKILKAYLDYRKGVAAKYDQQLMIEEGRKEDELKEEKNEKARIQIIKAYNELKEQYLETFDIDDSKIQAFWARILLECGVIEFTPEEKASIYEESKVLAKNQIVFELQEDGKLIPAQKSSLRAILKSVAECEHGQPLPTDFKAKATAIYSKLLIKKSIINSEQ